MPREALALGLFALLVAAPAVPIRADAPGGRCRAALPDLPAQAIDTRLPPASGRVIAVPEGGDLQSALDRAAPGDQITLQPGSVYTGPFRLPAKVGEGWIVVRSAAGDGVLPPPGRRVTPAQAPSMPKLEASSGSVLEAAPRAHHYRFIGLELRPRSGRFLYNLVMLGSDERSVEQLPHDIIFERCYLHGDPIRGTRRGIALNARDVAVIDSTLSDFKEVGADSQAIGGWNGPGPFLIRNNYLEGAGENVIFGGSTPSIHKLVPSDIVIQDNHFSKPLAWKSDEPEFAGTLWSIKNLLELKNARRVLVERNLFENCWAQAQRGFALLLTVRTELDTAPWAVVEDVTIRGNIVVRSASGVNLLGIDDSSASGAGRTRRVAIVGNLFDEIGGTRWGGNGILFQVLNGVADLLIEHNTALQAGPVISADLKPSPGLVFRNNIAPHNQYGVFGSGSGSGLPALSAYFPSFVFDKNVVAGAPEGVRYPSGNFFPPSLEEVGFTNAAAADFRLVAGSPYRGAATDGRDIGVDADALPAVEAIR